MYGLVSFQIEVQLSLKNAWLPPILVFILTTLAKICFSHEVINRAKLPLSYNVPSLSLSILDHPEEITKEGTGPSLNGPFARMLLKSC